MLEVRNDRGAGARLVAVDQSGNGTPRRATYAITAPGGGWDDADSGTVAAARKPSSVDSGGRQFFVVMRDQPSMKGQYTIFGEVVAGMEVVDQISLTPADGDKAKERVEMKVTVKEPAPAP